MGSGASQEVSAKVNENSAADLETLFKELPPDEVQKILKAAQAASGDAGSSESSAPFLRKAFKLLADCMEKAMEADEKGEDEPEIDEEKMQAEYFALIKQSFDHHDRKKAGKLDKDDAAVFFKNFMQESTVFMEAAMAKGIQIKMDGFKKELEKELEGDDEFPNAKDHVPGALKAAQAEFNKVLLLLRAKAKGNADAFAANKDSLTCMAFAMSDDNNDGILTYEEFKDMMDPGSDKHEQLLSTLGSSTNLLAEALDGDEFKDALRAAKEAGSMYLREKLGIKD